MTLSADSIRWAIEFLSRHSDGDIFPALPEISLVSTNPEGLIKSLSKDLLGNYPPQPCRKFTIPKGGLSYRQATQLHPQDSILLTSAIYQFGNGIVDRRLPKDTVFSYRFNPQDEEGLYKSEGQWNAFWTAAFEKSRKYPFVLYSDIADFYNQIYHHTVENQLAASIFPNQAIKWILNLLKATTANVSRGIPIGPHAAHLIAECTLIPIDNSLEAKGLVFLRYADDLLTFCASEYEASRALQTISSTLDLQQKLMVQSVKTKVFSREEFQQHCRQMLEDRPVNREEDEILKIVNKYSGGNPYVLVTYNRISDEDWEVFSEELVAKIVNEYLQADEVDYVRLRWFFRRLAQVGHPGAMKVIVNNIQLLEPCIPSVCSYITSIQSIPPEEWMEIGEALLGFLESEETLNNQFARLSILSLFSKNEHVDHFAKLARRYDQSDGHSRREILLAARTNFNADWLREHKENYDSMDPWQQLAFLYCTSLLPKEERAFFLRSISPKNCFDEELIGLSKIEIN